MSALVFALVLAILPPCSTEDAAGTVCGWDASSQGNGTGASFLVIGDAVIPAPAR